MSELTVYIADDHTFVRKSMVRLLSTFARVGEVKDASNGKELVNLVKKNEPDAVFLDLEMPVMSGIEAARYLLKHHPRVKILILTMHTEKFFTQKLIEMGVHGFLLKHDEPAEVEKALYETIDNEFYVNHRITSVFQGQKNDDAERPHPLSAREIEVLLLICKELSPKEISDRLGISEKTFFNHRFNLLLKTGSRSNISLVKFANDRGHLKKS